MTIPEGDKTGAGWSRVRLKEWCLEVQETMPDDLLPMLQNPSLRNTCHTG